MSTVKQLPVGSHQRFTELRVMRVLLVDPDCVRVRDFHQFIIDQKQIEHGQDNQVKIDITMTSTCGVWDQTSRMHPDLVVMPLTGQDSQRMAICRKIRNLHEARHIGIVFLDTREDLDSRDAMVSCLENGADDVISNDASNYEIMVRIKGVLRLKAMTDQLRRANHRLQVLSHTDELTGLSNMRAFDKKYAKALLNLPDKSGGLGVIMFDLDRFKEVNDSSNHLIGSHVIAEVGKIMRYSHLANEEDCMARYGGDEFVAFVHVESFQHLIDLIEGIRVMIEGAEFRKDGFVYHVTASIGASYISGQSPRQSDEILKAADAMCYLSKNQGRNRANAIDLTVEGSVDELTDQAQEKGRSSLFGLKLRKIS